MKDPAENRLYLAGAGSVGVAELPPVARRAAANRPLRWWLKKAGRTGVALMSSPAALAHARPTRRWPRVRVLTYHRFGDAARDPFCVGLRDFEQQMAWLARHHLAVSMRDVEQFLAGERSLTGDRVLVTIDDGFRSLHSRALPVLADYEIPALAFIPVGHVRADTSTPADAGDGDPEPRLTWTELAAVANAGVAIGSHSWTHRSLGCMPLDLVRTELTRSRAVLEHRLGRAVTAFAYPFGTRADYSAATTALLASSGYTCAFTSQHGALRPGMEALALPRVKVEGGEPPWLFRLLCRGGLDAWRWVDRTLWRLQARTQ